MRFVAISTGIVIATQCWTAQAQSVASAQPTFRAGVSLVEVAALVASGDGGPIDDLRAEDFEVYEDGQRRPLVSVRRVSPGSFRAGTPLTRPGDARREAFATNVGLADAPAFVLVLDDLNASPYDAHRVIRAGLGVLGAIPPEALVAVVTTSGVGGWLLTLGPPTPEHAAAIREFRGRMLLAGGKPPAMAESLVRSSGFRLGSSVDAPCGAVEFGRAQQQDCGDPTRAARRAQVVESVAKLLGRAGSRRKVVFWVTEDMGISPLDPQGNQAAQRSALKAVLNADVAVYPVNPREGQADLRNSADIQEGDRGDGRQDRRTGGTVRVGPGDGALGSPGGTSVEFNTDDMVAVTLGQLAQESGGRWITNANDLETVLADVVTQNLSSYLLAFEAAGSAVAGRHRIDVRVRRAASRIFARKGYIVTAGDRNGNATVADPASLLNELLTASVAQGQLRMHVQAVPEFLRGRTVATTVTVNVEDCGAPVTAVIVACTEDGRSLAPQTFQLMPSKGNSSWEFSTSLSLPRGRHQVRVAAATADGQRTGFVVAPVEVVQPGNDLLMASPLVLGGHEPEVQPTLIRTIDLGAPIRLRVDVAGKPLRDQDVAVNVSLEDASGAVVRDVAADLKVEARGDRGRATAEVASGGLTPGNYTVVVQARTESGTDRRVRQALPLVVRGEMPLVAPSVSLKALTVAHGPSTAEPITGAWTISDSDAWEAFWKRLPTTQQVPDIDFDRVTLVAIVADIDLASGGRPTVERVEREGDAAVVYWRLAGASAASAATQRSRAFVVAGLVGHRGPVLFRAVE